MKEKVESASRLLVLLMPEFQARVSELKILVEQSFAVGCEEYGEREAIRWANGFRFPENILSRDHEDLIKCKYDLTALVRRRHNVMRDRRLSTKSIKRISRDDPDLFLLKELVEGLRIFVSSDFVPNRSPPPLRRKYLRVSPAVNKVLMELYEKGDVLFLPTMVAKHIPNVHFSSTHWTTKSGKAKGRPLGDCSNAKSGSSLNSLEVKQIVDDHYGKICHPTLSDLMQLINRQALRVGRDQVACWKIDLAGAFSLLFIHPDDVRLAAFELTDGISMFYITGFFGGTGTPASFQVISRVLERHLNSLLAGRVHVYVDDIMGCCSFTELQSDMTIAIAECIGLLGKESVAHDKSDNSLATGKLTWIGWEVNLRDWTVSIGKKNFLKTLYGFFSVNEKELVPIKTLQRLASWASRYSTICRVMRPYTSNLYAEISGIKNKEISKLLNPRGILTIQMWRVFICMLELQGSRFCRNISSFGLHVSFIFSVEYDASLNGLGIVLHRQDNDTDLPRVWKVASIITSFAVIHDSSYQNTMEFIAIVMALAMLVKLGVRGASIAVTGDNTTSLSWVLSERFKGVRGQRAAVVYIALGITFDIEVNEATHVAGINNDLCDRLSRGLDPRLAGFKEDDIINVHQDAELSKILDLCDPLAEFSTEAELVSLWKNLNLTLSRM